MVNKKIICFVALLGIFVIAGCQRTSEQRAEHAVDYIAKKLELNDSQKKQLSGLKDELMAKRPEMEKQRAEAFDDIISFMENPQIDQGRLNSIAEKNQRNINEHVRYFFERIAAFQALLTPEQRERVVEELKKMKEGRGRHHCRAF